MIAEENLGILEAVPNPIIVVSPDETIVSANSLAEELFSYNRKQLLGKSAEELLSACSRNLYREILFELLKKPGRLKADLYALSQDGREFPVEVNFSQLAAGEDVSILNAFSANPGNGSSAERLYTEFFENADDVVFTLGLAGSCASLTATGEPLSGKGCAEALGRNIGQGLTPEHLDLLRGLMARAAGGEIVRGAEFEILAKDGRMKPLEVSARPIYRDGRVVAIQGIARDVSERNRLEQQWLQAQKVEAVGRLAGGVAHDFNNILTVVACYTDLLLQGLDPADPKFEYAEQIKGAGKKGSWLASQLIALSRKQAASPKVLNLNRIVSECAKMLGRLLGEDMRLATTLDPEIGMLKADQGQIEQIILNLAIHSRDAMPQGGQFTMATRNTDLDAAYIASHRGYRPGRHVTLEVSDTGPGPDRGSRIHIFEPVLKYGDGEKEDAGLAAVRAIVKQQRGCLSVGGNPGGGTTFTIHLPRFDETTTIR
jgi:two-component system, cell cycle sensor histidine kinase and response regulator CckA